MDVFISHASDDAAVAGRAQKALADDGLTVWLDRSGIRVGVLLRHQLQEAIRDSRVLVLLWSKAAAKSRWVAAELLTAFHSDRFVVPCVLDTARLPQFLGSDVYLVFGRGGRRVLSELRRAVREAPDRANAVLPAAASRSTEAELMAESINRLQHEMLAHLGRDMRRAASAQAEADALMRRAEKTWRFDPLILKLAGYHRKNAYMLRHWDEIQAGRSPDDSLLTRAERFFFDSLFVDPFDSEALNGLGSILVLEREMEAAEFFVRRAIALAEQDDVDYAEAKHDLALILRYTHRT